MEKQLLFTYFNEHTAVWFLQRHTQETPRFGQKCVPVILEKPNTGRQQGLRDQGTNSKVQMPAPPRPNHVSSRQSPNLSEL